VLEDGIDDDGCVLCTYEYNTAYLVSVVDGLNLAPKTKFVGPLITHFTSFFSLRYL
jgi:hypothetical protein